VALFQASSEFAKSADPDAVSFARQLRTMALNIARGVARYGYDSDRGVFRQYLGHDGSPFQDPARYTFPTQAQKEEAMKTDPSVKDAVVYDGSGFYEPGPYSLHSAGSDIPWEIAWCARESRDPCLIQQTRAFAELAVTASARVQRPFTREWKWTFRASGFYIRVMTTLFELTGERPYLDWAQSLADAEMENLGRVRYPEWWRFPERLEFLEGVLSICAALRNG
jgi:hypothetical protein